MTESDAPEPHQEALAVVARAKRNEQWTVVAFCAATAVGLTAVVVIGAATLRSQNHLSRQNHQILSGQVASQDATIANDQVELRVLESEVRTLSAQVIGLGGRPELLPIPTTTVAP